jgi:hypothetical protein
MMSKMMAKALVFEKKPFSRVHSIMTSQGFKLMDYGRLIKYRVTMRDSSTESIYLLEVPVDHYPKDFNQAKLGKPSLYGEERIPQSVREAAESKLYEIADYLKSKIVKRDQPDNNGSMAQNADEMIRLGKEMESLQTQADLDQVGLIPDPNQYESKS